MSELFPYPCPKCKQNVSIAHGLRCPNCDGVGAVMYQQSDESSRKGHQENACNPEIPALSQGFGSYAGTSNYLQVPNNNQLVGGQVFLNNIAFPGFHQESSSKVGANQGFEELVSFGNNRLSNTGEGFVSATLPSSPYIDHHSFIHNRMSTACNEIVTSGALDIGKSKNAGVHSVDNTSTVPGTSNQNIFATNLSASKFQFGSEMEHQVLPPVDDKPFICQFCQKELDTHDVGAFYKCCQCRFKCSIKNDLKKHFKIHLF